MAFTGYYCPIDTTTGFCYSTNDKNPPFTNLNVCFAACVNAMKHRKWPDVRWMCDKHNYKCIGTDDWTDKKYPYTHQNLCTTDCIKPPPPPPPPPSKGLSPGIIVIIILVPLILIGIAVGVFVWKRKHKSILTSTSAVPVESSAEEIPTSVK